MASRKKRQPPASADTPSVPDAGYATRKERERQRQAQQTRSGQDIGPIPQCKDPKRRAKAERKLAVWMRTYLAEWFHLPMSKAQEEDCADMQAVIESDGGRRAKAAPRGDGKTTRTIAGVLYAVATGKRRFAALLTATATQAPDRVAPVKAALLQPGTPLAEDYPEICYPIQKMEGQSNRCKGMRSEGHLLWPALNGSAWSARRIILPTVQGSRASSAILQVSGLLQAVRGLTYARPDGRIDRPDVVLIDDPQTDASAASPLQCSRREKAITKGILPLCGPDKMLTAFATVTVIEPDDMADHLLDRTIHPEWHGVRRRLLDKLPTNMKLWEEYAEIFREELAAGSVTFPKSARFYRSKKNRKRLDAGAVVSWEERHPGAVSAIEFAMRLYFADRSAFQSEYQNEPEKEEVSAEAVVIASPAVLARHTNGYRRGQIPVAAEKLTFFIDVHKSLLYWVICGWATNYTGWLIDYGTWPEQPTKYFEMRHAKRTIQNCRAIDATTQEGQISQALHALLGELAARTFTRDDDAPMRLDLGLIDANWGEETDTVYSVAAECQTKHGLFVIPAHGQPFGPAKRPMANWDKGKTKGVLGENWHYPPPARGRPVRHVLIDANRRKSFLFARLGTPIGDPGSLSFFASPPATHRMLAEQLNSEQPHEVSGQWGKMTMYTQKPNRDNHLLDAMSGAATAASMLGVRLQRSEAAAGRKDASKRKPRTKPKTVSGTTTLDWD